MKQFVIALLAGAFLFGLGLKVFAAGSGMLPVVPGEGSGTIRPGVEVPEARRALACPATRYINCMPPVEKSARKWCAPEYLQWIKSNCPEITVVY